MRATVVSKFAVELLAQRRRFQRFEKLSGSREVGKATRTRFSEGGGLEGAAYSSCVRRKIRNAISAWFGDGHGTPFGVTSTWASSRTFKSANAETICWVVCASSV